VGANAYTLFDGVKGDIKLELAGTKEMGDGKIWLNYNVRQS